jgi:hypothetical protein
MLLESGTDSPMVIHKMISHMYLILRYNYSCSTDPIREGVGVKELWRTLWALPVKPGFPSYPRYNNHIIFSFK